MALLNPVTGISKSWLLCPTRGQDPRPVASPPPSVAGWSGGEQTCPPSGRRRRHQTLLSDHTCSPVAGLLVAPPATPISSKALIEVCVRESLLSVSCHPAKSACVASTASESSVRQSASRAAALLLLLVIVFFPLDSCHPRLLLCIVVLCQSLHLSL